MDDIFCGRHDVISCVCHSCEPEFYLLQSILLWRSCSLTSPEPNLTRNRNKPVTLCTHIFALYCFFNFCTSCEPTNKATNMDKKPPANPGPPSAPQGTVPVLPSQTAALNAAPLVPNQPIPPQMMNFVTDPALANAAASLFPSQAMMGNPNGFLAMPQLFPGASMQPPNAPKPGDTPAAHSQPPQMVINQTMQTGFNSRSIQTNGAAPPIWAQPPMLPTSSAMLPGMMQPPKSAQSSAMQVHLAAATAAAAAVPSSKKLSGKAAAKEKKKNELSAEEKARASRDRNREHARSTRLRKKAYVQKLKELVEGLHAERTEEVRKRRVAVQHLAEKQSVRRAVVRSFLQFHASYEGDPRKWMTLLEDNFWFKQPVTPYRSFRRAEIEQVCFWNPDS